MIRYSKRHSWNGCQLPLGYEDDYKAPHLSAVLSLVSTSVECECFFLPTCYKSTQGASVISSLADCWDVNALSKGDSSCHGCQAARPAAYQTAGYSVTGDTLNQLLKRNCCQPRTTADSRSSDRLKRGQLHSR